MSSHKISKLSSKSSEAINKETIFSHAKCFQCSWRMGFLLVALLGVVTGLIWGQTTISEETEVGERLLDDDDTVISHKDSKCFASKLETAGTASDPWRCKELVITDEAGGNGGLNNEDTSSNQGTKDKKGKLREHLEDASKVDGKVLRCVALDRETFGSVLQGPGWVTRVWMGYFSGYNYWSLKKEVDDQQQPSILYWEQEGWWNSYGTTVTYYKLLSLGLSHDDGMFWFWQLSSSKFFGCYRKEVGGGHMPGNSPLYSALPEPLVDA